MIRNTFFPSASLILFLGLAACNNGAGSRSLDIPADTITSEAKLLTISKTDRYTLVQIKNPWDSTATLANYVLVNRDFSSDSLALLPEGTVVRVPLQSSLVYSGAYGGVIDELGASDAISSVADGQYFNTPELKQRIASGKITDVGSSMSPSVEKIVNLNPEAILTSPYQNSGHGAIETLKIPIIEMADYMECTPLGRAEWIKLIGCLYGEEERADSIFNTVKAKYNELKNLAASSSGKPMVITEQSVNGVWAMPGGRSYMSTMLQDAGALYPWSSDASLGSIELTPAEVLDKADQADFWFIKSYGPMDLSNLKANNSVNSKIKAFGNGGVYVCDTSISPLFDEFPFHPELLLSDYITIIHPELSGEPHYFHRAK